ncbi:MAG TPA: response regulator [Armatimonadetes bacterium]|nr:response regulator [Armatimonadota bacterium]
MPARVLIADASEDMRATLRELLELESNIEVVDETDDGSEVTALIGPLRVDIVLLDIDLSGADAITLTERITTQYPTCGVIITSPAADPERMRAAMQAGASDYLVKPLSGPELTGSIERIYQRLARVKTAVLPGGEEVTLPSKTVSVYSPQGGVGKSMLAVNLGVCLAQESGKNTVLVDLNLQFGDVDLMLNIMPERTIAAIIPRLNQLDADLMESFLTTHPASGLKVLVAPTRPEYADTITVFVVEKILQVLRERYTYIVVDTPSVLQDTTLTALDHSDLILLLTALDLLALHNTKIALEMMQKLRYSEDKVRLVLNRSNADVGISVEDVEEALDYPITAFIPSDGRVAVTSVNEGEPFVLSHPHTQIAQSIRRIAYLVMGREEEFSPEVALEAREESARRARRGILEILFGSAQ